MQQDEERAWFARMLWRAFPEARSESELADLASAVLTAGSRPVTSRAVRYWLQGTTTPHFRYVLAVLALVGVEAIADFIASEADR